MHRHCHRDRPPGTINLPYRLSLSHSANLCLCASTTTAARIGCDVEWQRPSLRAIARQYFHPTEAAYLNGLDDNRARDAFYRLWTLKEAAQKALGHGLAGGLRIPAFSVQPQLRCLAPPSKQPWLFGSHELIRPCGHYSLALAFAGPAMQAPQLKVSEFRSSKRGMNRHDHQWPWAITQTASLPS